MTKSAENTTKIELHITPQSTDDNETFDGFAYADKRERVWWTPEEIKILEEGVKKYGKGRWKEILNNFKDDLNPFRRMKDLSDKVRILEHQTTYCRRQKRDHWELDKNNDPVCKMGEKVIYSTKLPFEAATKCAYTKNYSAGTSVIIKIAYEEAGKLWVHIYSAKYVKSDNYRHRIKVRKVAGQSPYRKDNM